jgi:NADPH-dependent 2,4-dienoyl-CoA reductase/sulfur reductase-like enzyme
MTSARDVYAAGDAAECRDAATGKKFGSALWTNAVDMGKQAGRNMAGAKAGGVDALPVMNAAEIAGVPMVSAGMVEAGKGYEVRVTRENGSSLEQDVEKRFSFLLKIANNFAQGSSLHYT